MPVSTDALVLGLLVLLLIWIGASTFFVVNQQTAAVVEHFGRFDRIAEAGLHTKIPIIERIRERTLSYTFRTHFHPYVGELVNRLVTGSVDGLQAADTEEDLSAELMTAGKYGPTALVTKPYPVADLDFTISGAYAVYNWELFFHVPLTIAVHLSKNQRFAEAQRWFHYIFDPTSNDDQVDAAEDRLDARERAHRPHVRVEVEVLPERDVDAPVADTDARLQRTLERDLVLLDRREERIGNRVVACDDRRLAAELLVPLDLRAGALEPESTDNSAVPCVCAGRVDYRA